jgi:hypothetical protein
MTDPIVLADGRVQAQPRERISGLPDTPNGRPRIRVHVVGSRSPRGMIGIQVTVGGILSG